jgi:hypothetical protein
MLKKSLVALAIASVAGMASAADITDTEYQILSAQGAVGTENVVVANDVVVKLAAEYKVDDIIKFNFAGVDIDEAASILVTKVLLANDPATGADAKNPDVEDVPFGTMTLGLLSSDKNSLTYRVTSLDYADEKPENTTKGGTITLEGLKFEVSSLLTSGSGSVAYSAETSTGIELDKAKTNSTVLFDVKNQFAASVPTKLDAVIDVNEQRLRFEVLSDVPIATDYHQDSVALKAEQIQYKDADDANVDFALPATIEGMKATLVGDFSFLGEANADTGLITTDKVTVDDSAGAVAEPNPTVKVYADKIVVERVDAALDTVTITIDVAGDEKPGFADKAINTQQFTAEIDVNYETASGKANQVFEAGNKLNAGEWTLNGAVVHVPFMPFRDGYAPIVNVSNTSTQDGDIEVLVYAENNAEWVEPVSYMLPVQAKAQAQTNITGALKSVGIEGDVAFDIIVNAPKDDIEVSALYYNNGDRAVMQTVKEE